MIVYDRYDEVCNVKNLKNCIHDCVSVDLSYLRTLGFVLHRNLEKIIQTKYLIEA